MAAYGGPAPNIGSLLSLEGEAFVRQAYKRLLNRDADATGLSSCLEQLRAGVPKETILTAMESTPEGRLARRRRGGVSFATRPEGVSSSAKPLSPQPGDVQQLLALDAGEFLQHAYSLVLGRRADPEGLQSFSARMASGETAAQILRDLALSDEAKAYGHRLAGLSEWLRSSADRPAGMRHVADIAQLLAIEDDAGFLNATYWYVLGRPADQAGFAHLQQLIATGTSREVIVREIAISTEGLAASQDGLSGLAEWLSTEAAQVVSPVQDEIAPQAVSHVNELLAISGEDEFLRAAYWNVMGRAIDLPGLENCQSLLGLGWSRLYILQGLRNSDEGRQARARLVGLDGRIRNYEKAQKRSWSGWYRRSVLGAESDMPADRQLRAIYRSVTR